MNQLLSELRRRNVFRVAAAYLVGGWLVLQIVGAIEASAGLPDWTDGMALVVLLIGLPIALVIAWAFELTPEGLRKTDSASTQAEPASLGNTDFVLIGLMVLVVGLVGFQMNRSGTVPQVQTAEVELAAVVVEDTVAEINDMPSLTTAAPALSVAVLPFVAMSSNENDGYFADGLTEEILNSLAALPELLVTSRTSAFQFKGDNIPSVPEIARRLGVAHIVEGSVRRAGEQVRITVQVIRVADDSHLWSQTYDRTMDDIFAVQEDIATNIAGVLDVVLDEGKRQLMRNTGVDNVEAYIAYQRGYDLSAEAHVTPFTNLELLAEADQYFAEATRLVPDFSDAYFLQSDQFAHLMFDARNFGNAEQRAIHDAARERYFELLDLARATTQDPSRRALLNIERIYFSDNWTGANAILDEVLQVTGCPADGWLVDMVILSGRAAEFIPYFERQAQCNPLEGQSWGLLKMIHASAGQLEQALGVVEHSLSLNPDNESVQRGRAYLLSRTGRLDELAAFLDSNQQSHTPYDLLRALEAGDRRVVQDIYVANGASGADILADLEIVLPALGRARTISLLAQMGERDLVNERAANLDAFSGSTNELMTAIDNCRCGAPWDIEVTPNFAARMAEAEFPWPPPGTGDFPLKDW